MERIGGERESGGSVLLMNCKVFTLPEISSDLCHVRDIVSSVLHTILFGRALGPIRPKDVECSSLDITYVHCGDKAVQREVADRVDQLLAYLHRRCVAQPIEQKGNSYYTNSGSNRGQNNMNSAALCGSSTAISLAVTISFYEKRYKQSWFSKQQEKKYWEQWCDSQHPTISVVFCSSYRKYPRDQIHNT